MTDSRYVVQLNGIPHPASCSVSLCSSKGLKRRHKFLHLHLNLFSSVFPAKIVIRSQKIFFLPSIILLSNSLAVDILFSLLSPPDWAETILTVVCFTTRTLLAGQRGDLCSSCFPKAGSRAWKIGIIKGSEVLEAGIKNSLHKTRTVRSGIAAATTRNWECRTLVTPRAFPAAMSVVRGRAKTWRRKALGSLVWGSLETPSISFNASGCLDWFVRCTSS